MNEEKLEKANEVFGLKIGFLFFGLSMLLGLTMIGPMIIGSILETASSGLASFTNGNVGITAFYISIVGLIVPIIFYVKDIRKKSPNIDNKLVILFLFFMVFLNTALFYKDWLSPNFRMDGQQAFGLFIMPLKTSFVYLVVGLIHDFIKKKLQIKY